jgi:hypothetical protein
VWLRLQLERKRLGLQFELIDGGRVAPPGPSKKVVLTVVAILVFLFTLPLAMLGVGAIDDRVYEAEDVQRLGLIALGELPGFGGDNRGTLEERLAVERRQRREHERRRRVEERERERERHEHARQERQQRPPPDGKGNG